MKYYVVYTTMHRHITIMTSETFVNSSMESCMASGDRAVNANGERVSDYSAHGHSRHELYRAGSILRVYLWYTSRHGYT